MGGLARAAGDRRLTLANEPVWLEGDDAALPRWTGRPIVWLLDLARAGDRRRLETIAPGLDESKAFARHRDAGERRLRRGAARLLLSAASATPLGEVVVTNDPFGAPVVAAPTGWWISAAARWPRMVVAVARQPLGVDLEIAAEPLPDDLLTPSERRRLAALSPRLRLLAGASAWAAKEAHAKWTGRPRAVDPAGVETAEPDRVRSAHGQTRCWRLARGEAVVALCLVAGDAIR